MSVNISGVTMTPNTVDAGKTFYISVQVVDNNEGLWMVDRLANYIKDKLGTFLKYKR